MFSQKKFEEVKNKKTIGYFYMHRHIEKWLNSIIFGTLEDNERCMKGTCPN